jgi:hypothetical protein
MCYHSPENPIENYFTKEEFVKLKELVVKLNSLFHKAKNTSTNAANVINLVNEAHNTKIQIIELIGKNKFQKMTFNALFNPHCFVSGILVSKNYDEELAKYEKQMIEYNKFIEERKLKKRIEREERKHKLEIEKQNKQLEKEKRLLDELLAKHSKMNLEACSKNAPVLDPKRKYI